MSGLQSLSAGFSLFFALVALYPPGENRNPIDLVLIFFSGVALFFACWSSTP